MLENGVESAITASTKGTANVEERGARSLEGEMYLKLSCFLGVSLPVTVSPVVIELLTWQQDIVLSLCDRALTSHSATEASCEDSLRRDDANICTKHPRTTIIAEFNVSHYGGIKGYVPKASTISLSTTSTAHPTRLALLTILFASSTSA